MRGSHRKARRKEEDDDEEAKNFVFKITYTLIIVAVNVRIRTVPS